MVVNGIKNRPVLPQKLFQQHHLRIHHAKPFVVAGEILRLLGNDGAELAEWHFLVVTDYLNQLAVADFHWRESLGSGNAPG